MSGNQHRTGMTIRRRGVSQLMREVMLALVPGTLLYAALIDSRVLVNVLLASLAAVAFEALALSLRRRPLRPALGDGSAALAGWLLALSVPPLLPVWQLVIGSGVALLIGKHVFGGLGHNPFNPAMVGYAVLLVSFPVTMTTWPSVGMIGQATIVQPATRMGDPGLEGWDAITAQTPLDRLRTYAGEPQDRLDGDAAIDLSSSTMTSGSAAAMAPGSIVLGSHWTLVALGWLVGGVGLLARRIIAWHIPVSVLGSLAACHAAGHWVLGAEVLPPFPALFAGGAMLGAFFIATDPVSAAASARGRLVYGAGIGVLAFVIREFSAWPEGIAFAVLGMNAAVPLIDRLSTPRSDR